jgi:hypothetical protein
MCFSSLITGIFDSQKSWFRVGGQGSWYGKFSVFVDGTGKNK